MDIHKMSEWLTGELEYWEKQLLVNGLTPEQQRVLRRFALVATAGALAVDFGILPYTEDQVKNCVEIARNQWLQAMRESDPALMGIINVARFVVEQSNQCVDYSDKRSGKSLVLIPAELFSEACSGTNHRTVFSKLSELGLLHRQERSRATSQLTVKGKKGRYYALKPDIRSHYITAN